MNQRNSNHIKMEYCIDCGNRIRGRTDKKFCNDHCRSHHHNALNRGRNNVFKEVNHILRKNTGILEQFIQQGVSQIGKQTLAATGFDFNYFTNMISVPGGSTYYGIYHYAYRHHEEEQIELLPAAEIWQEI